jgi:hypothetical protein
MKKEQQSRGRDIESFEHFREGAYANAESESIPNLSKIEIKPPQN